jgi:hypothetical protein
MELGCETYVGEGAYYCECVGANPMFIAQGVRILGLLKLPINRF